MTEQIRVINSFPLQTVRKINSYRLVELVPDLQVQRLDVDWTMYAEFSLGLD